jgi:Tol biopolymer transport system component
MADPLHQELIRQAVEAARNKDRETALDLLKEVLEEDEDNITAWLLFARVTRDVDQKRAALETVLQIDPENEKATAQLAKLDAESKARKTQEVEIAPGVSKRTFTMVAGGIAGIVVLLIFLVVIVQISKKSKESSQERSLTHQAATQMELAAQLTQNAFLEQTAAFNATQTQIAISTPTPSPVPTSGLPTLPPSFTPPPTVSDTGPEPLAPPAGITGIISGWSGRDLLNTDSLPLALYTLTGEATQVTPQIIDVEDGQHGFLSPDNTRLVYSRYIRQDGSYDVTMVDLNGERVSSPLSQAPTIGRYLVSSMPAFSFDGTKLTFVGDSLESFTSEVYLVDLTADPQTATIRLTNDEANYRFPSFSPDGSKIVVVRSNPTNPENPGPDLVIIDVASLTMSALTTDNDQIRETMPRWSPDGGIIAFAGTTELSAQDQHDLYIIAADRKGSGSVIVDDPVNAIYPVYSPDGQYLAFASNRSGFYEIYIIDLVTRDLYQVTNSREEDYPANWIPLEGSESTGDTEGE